MSFSPLLASILDVLRGFSDDHAWLVYLKELLQICLEFFIVPVWTIWALYRARWNYKHRQHMDEVSVSACRILFQMKNLPAAPGKLPKRSKAVLFPRTVAQHPLKMVVGDSAHAAGLLVKAAKRLKNGSSLLRLEPEDCNRIMSSIVGEVSCIRGDAIVGQDANGVFEEESYLTALIVEKPDFDDDGIDAKFTVLMISIDNLNRLLRYPYLLQPELKTRKICRRVLSLLEILDAYPDFRARKPWTKGLAMKQVKVPRRPLHIVSDKTSGVREEDELPEAEAEGEADHDHNRSNHQVQPSAILS